MKRTTTTTATVLSALALAISGCGGSDDAASDTVPVVDTAVVDSAPATEPTPDTTPATEAVTTEAVTTEEMTTDPPTTGAPTTEATGAGAVDPGAAPGSAAPDTAVAGSTGETPAAGSIVAGERWVAPSGDYSVIFPADSITRMVEQTVPLGTEELVVEVYLAELADGTATTAVQFDYSTLEAQVDPDLQGAVDGAIANIPQGELTSQENRVIDGRDAIDYEFTVAGGQGQGRALVVKLDQKIIQLQVIGAAGGELPDYIDTFQLEAAG